MASIKTQLEVHLIQLLEKYIAWSIKLLYGASCVAFLIPEVASAQVENDPGMAMAYASRYSVSVADANTRMSYQDSIAEFGRIMEEDETGDFARLYVSHFPYKIMIGL